MKESILREKSYQFALRIIKLYKFISAEKKEFVRQSKFYDREHLLVRISKKQIKHNQKWILFICSQSLKRKPEKQITG
jgi:hypothetical protein